MVIGVYESFAWQMPDGSENAYLYVTLGSDVEKALDAAGERLHRACASEGVDVQQKLEG